MPEGVPSFTVSQAKNPTSLPQNSKFTNKLTTEKNLLVGINNNPNISKVSKYYFNKLGGSWVSSPIGRIKKKNTQTLFIHSLVVLSEVLLSN